MDIKYKFASLLTEGYNFTNVDEVMSAIKTNQVGIKILRFFKDENQDHVSIKLAFKKFFETCESLGIKDTTYGVQLLCSKCETLQDLKNAVDNDSLYEFLKSYKKPWVKQLPEYKEVLANLYNSTLWHNFEKAVQEEQSKHGKVSKGSGELKDVKIPYDDGTWKLLIPSSFQGTKAASFYIKDGQEVPTNWCTRVDNYYYKRYTENAPLYIIRNMKTGKSYQMAFTIESGPRWGDEDNKNETITVHFLDQNDENGDEITNGDLSKIPNELLKHIPIPGKNKTMANYNTDKAEPSPHAGEKGYIKTDQETWGKEQIVDKKYQREICKILDKNYNSRDYYYDKFGERDIVKIVSNKSYFEDNYNNNRLSHYANVGKKIEDNYKPKARKIRYYFLGHPEKYVEIIASKKAGAVKPLVNKATEQGKERNVLQYTAFYELGSSIPKEIVNYGHFTYISKNQEADFEAHGKLQKKENYFENKIENFVKNKFKSLGFTLTEYFDNILNRKVPKRVKEIKKFRIGPDHTSTSTSVPGKFWSVTLKKENTKFNVTVYFKKLPIKKENMRVNVAEDGTKEIEPSPQFVDTCFEISKFIFDVWRKNFHDEIVQYRSEGLNKSNIYEGVRQGLKETLTEGYHGKFTPAVNYKAVQKYIIEARKALKANDFENAEKFVWKAKETMHEDDMQHLSYKNAYNIMKKELSNIETAIRKGRKN